MLATTDFGRIKVVNRHYANDYARRECFRYDGNGDYNNLVTTSAGKIFAVVQLFNGDIVAYHAGDRIGGMKNEVERIKKGYQRGIHIS